jgi:RNA polymerase sigma-70 factor (ECF subfamily)
MEPRTSDPARDALTASLPELLAAAWPRAYRLSQAILHDRIDAEDAVQDACLRVTRQLDTLRDEAAFESWFLKIVSREAIRISKQRKRSAPEELRYDRTGVVAAEVIDLRDALAALPQTLRTPLLLSVYAGLRGDEIAELVGTTPGNVRFRIWKAKTALKELLSPKDATNGEYIRAIC